MNIRLNDQTLQVACEAPLTLGGLLDDLRARGAIAADEVVVDIRVDGLDWNAQDLEARKEDALPQGSDVVIATDDSRGYGRRILTDAAGMVDILQEAARTVAHALREETPEQANADLFMMLDAVQRLLVCLHQIQNTYGLKRGLTAGPEPLLNGISEALQEMQACQESQDWPALAESVENRLAPALQGVGRVVQTMKDEL